MSLAKVIGPDIEELIRENPKDLAAAVANMHPADLAELLDDLPRDDRITLFEALPVEQGAAVLSELKGETLRLILHSASPAKLGPMLDRLPADEVTFLLEHLTQRQRESILARMSPRDAAEVQRLLRYPPRTAGRLMTEKFATIRPEWTVAETLDHLKRIDPEVETVQSLYALDPNGRLVGYVALRRLFPAPPGPQDRRHDGAAAPDRAADATQEEVARLVSKYDVHAIPVVDEENRLLGIVTVDDVIDILIEEQTEDVLHMGGVSATEEAVEQGYFATKPWRNVRSRFTWLLLLFVAATFTGHGAPPLRERGRESRGARVLHPAPHRHRRQLRLPDGHDDRSGARGGRDPIAGRRSRSPARGGQRCRPGSPARHRRLRPGHALGHGPASRHDRRRLDPGHLRLGQCGRRHGSDARHALRIDPTVMSAPLIATLVDATGLIIYFTIAKSFLGL